MAGKITDLWELTGATAAPGDLVEVVDVSDTSMAASGTNKRMALSEFVALSTTVSGVVAEGGYIPGTQYNINGTSGNGTLNQLAGHLFMVPAIFGANATISTLGFYLAGGAPTTERRFWLAMYADTGASVPGTRLFTGEMVFPIGTGSGLKSLAVSIPVVRNRVYWIGLNADYNNGGDYWYTTVPFMPARSWSWIVDKNTGYVQPPDPCGVVDPNMGGYGAPWFYFAVA